MRLPQDSVDVVVGDTAVVAMETVLRGASRVFRLRAEGGRGAAVVLAVYARPGGGHHHSLRAADPVAAVAAGRLETQKRERWRHEEQPSGLMDRCQRFK